MEKMIARYYGEEHQMKIMVEECAELIQAICKQDRGDSREHYIEELADVHIMVKQLIALMGESDYEKFTATIKLKLERQLERMANESK